MLANDDMHINLRFGGNQMSDKNEKAELWDIYTKERLKTGKLQKRGEKLSDDEYHLVIHVCIFNNKNQLLIQQRQPFKTGWPNMWDLSVGGSAIAGESSGQAAERELAEELGLKMDLSDVLPQFTTTFRNGFDDYYIVKNDVDLTHIKLQKEEVQAVRWADKEEVLKMQQEGTFIPYWFLDKLFELDSWYNTFRNEDSAIKITYASNENLSSWMSMVETVKWNFPGLETEEKVIEYKNTVKKNIDRGTAICALFGNMVVGILLFSIKHNMLCCMAIHPEFRRKHIASKMVKVMLDRMDKNRPIVVETFREEDEKGTAPRAFYKKAGFEEGELCFFENEYPEQRFYLRRW